MSDALLRPADTPFDAPLQALSGATVEIVVPVRNEERDLGPSVRRLHAFLRAQLP